MQQGEDLQGLVTKPGMSLRQPVALKLVAAVSRNWNVRISIEIPKLHFGAVHDGFAV